METVSIDNLPHQHILANSDKSPPHVIKYMGSKRNVLENVITGIEAIYHGNEIVLDLFAGTSILSGAIGKLVPVHSNDIQSYSAILAKLYLSNHEWTNTVNPDTFLDEYRNSALQNYNALANQVQPFLVNYNNVNTLHDFNELERTQRELLNHEFNLNNYHLFTKYYSGTYWSLEQCMWIDSLKFAADTFQGESIYYALLSSLMFAMAYNSQSTGHYAQYRDANNEASMKDILSYRLREIFPLFQRKFKELAQYLEPNTLQHNVTTLDYEECLDTINGNYIVYADPPYCFVHYSRFYHALETLVRYDYPEVKFKGRYRTDRHQSPFCQNANVEMAFRTMCSKINRANAKLVLSYSNTGMISLEELKKIVREEFNESYVVRTVLFDHQHSTMGRLNDKSRDVTECLVIVEHNR